MGLDKQEILRLLPSVDEVTHYVYGRLSVQPHNLITMETRRVINQWRRTILENGQPVLRTREQALNLVGEDVIAGVGRLSRPVLRRVINATGVVLHTNLGRAILSKEAREAVSQAAGFYSNLEFDLSLGKRGSRYTLVEGLLCELTGAEAAMVVNNNAAAVLLALSTIARGQKVIVSRGQLVEIGGSFRIPEVMAQSGARLVEVGATNKTHRRDYENAIDDETALLLHVHMSNYRIVGFTAEVSVEELVSVGRAAGLPVMSDLGSGFLIDLSHYGLPYEPTVQEIVRAGSDIVTFSGDKLLGGPQAGIIVGQKSVLERMKKNPLNRAVRPDKMTLSGLEATLRAYRDPQGALRNIPTLRMLTMPLAELQTMAAKLEETLRQEVGDRAEVHILDGVSQVGGGAMPMATPPTRLVAVRPAATTVESMVSLLRDAEPAVIGRVQDGIFLLDVRTLQEGEIALVARQVAAALRRP